MKKKTGRQLFVKILSPWYILVYKYIECILGRVPLESLLPARVMWINIEYIPVATCQWFFFAPRDVFFKLKPSPNALHICIYWYISRAQNVCKQLYIYGTSKWGAIMRCECVQNCCCPQSFCGWVAFDKEKVEEGKTKSVDNKQNTLQSRFLTYCFRSLNFKRWWQWSIVNYWKKRKHI